MKKPKKVFFFAYRKIGLKFYNYFSKLSKYETHLLAIHRNDANLFKNVKHNKLLFNKKDLNKCWDSIYKELKKNDIDTCILAWWPFIVPKKIVKLKNLRIINFHPSFLPYGRGKDSNFWSIVNQSPYGVSIMKINSNIDEGDYYIRKKIEYDILDTGETLYKKSQNQIFIIYKQNIEKILENKLTLKKQVLENGTYNKRSDMLNITRIRLNKSYKAIDLINILRAKNFKGHESCYFRYKNKNYEINLKIREKK